MRGFLLALSIFAMLAFGCGDGGGGDTAQCQPAASSSLRECVKALNDATRACYTNEDRACGTDDAAVVSALDAVQASLDDACGSDQVVVDSGFGSNRTLSDLVSKLQESCVSETDSLSARTYGGPRGAVWTDADEATRACLTDAHASAAMLMDQAYGARAQCIVDDCDVAALSTQIDELVASARSDIEASCTALEESIAVSADVFAERALAQSECMIAMSHGNTAPLSLRCGPRDAVTLPPRGQYTQVVLDSAEWGTKCGDGSPFAFQFRPAPEGEPVENVIIAMQGGGVCVGILGGDCQARYESSPGLFEAMDDQPETTGIMSSDPAISPFANWTKVYLPYCTQDVFVGGGVTNVFGEGEAAVTVERYGAVNVRAALRYVRDAIWKELDAQSAEGYRPDRMQVYFGGFSAGAFGTLYNYHYLLDDLQWERTTAFPDAALAIDNGADLVGIVGLGNILITGAPENGGWQARDFLPPYCFTGQCAAGPRLLEVTSPRLKEVPAQRLMILSNQWDQTQVETTYFANTETWINAMRQSYCDTQGLPGVHYFLPAIPESVHVISTDDSRFTTRAVDGQTMRQWFAGALSDPDAVEDRVEEGNYVSLFEQSVPPVEPFPCSVAP
ncbi:MAG: pectin acetylesterase-family hydrolase [Myxococcales bacterium]